MKKLCLILLIGVLFVRGQATGSGDIALTSGDGDGAAISRIDSNGAGLRKIMKDAVDPQWSPDGKLLAAIGKNSRLIIFDGKGKIVHKVDGNEMWARPVRQGRSFTQRWTRNMSQSPNSKRESNSAGKSRGS